MIADVIVWKTLTSSTQDSSPTFNAHCLPPTQILSSYEAHNTTQFHACAVKIQFLIHCQGTLLQTSYIFLHDGCNISSEKSCQIPRSVFPAALFRVCFVRV